MIWLMRYAKRTSGCAGWLRAMAVMSAWASIVFWSLYPRPTPAKPKTPAAVEDVQLKKAIELLSEKANAAKAGA